MKLKVYLLSKIQKVMFDQLSVIRIQFVFGTNIIKIQVQIINLFGLIFFTDLSDLIKYTQLVPVKFILGPPCIFCSNRGICSNRGSDTIEREKKLINIYNNQSNRRASFTTSFHLPWLITREKIWCCRSGDLGIISPVNCPVSSLSW